MNRWITFCLGFVISVWALVSVQYAETPPNGQAAQMSAKYWLEKADKAINVIEGEKERFSARSYLCLGYADAGDIKRAKAVVAKLPGRKRHVCMGFIGIGQADAGDFSGAIETVQSIKDPNLAARFLGEIASICAKTDIPQALKIAATVSGPRRCYAYANIVKQQAHTGDLKSAQATANKILDPEYKEMANESLVTGKTFLHVLEIMEKGDDPNTIAVGTKGGLEHLYEPLLKGILEIKAKAGKLDQAREILKHLKSPEHRAAGYIAIATYQCEHGSKKDLDRTIEQAICEVHKIEDSDMIYLQKFTYYLGIAALQITAGDTDEGVKTVKLAYKCGQKTIFGMFDSGFLEPLIIKLLVAADRPDEAMKIATNKDGTINPEAIPWLLQAYASAGNMEKVNELLESFGKQTNQSRLYISIATGLLEYTKQAKTGR